MKLEGFGLRYGYASAVKEASTGDLTGVPNQCYGLGPDETFGGLLYRADLALYQAKAKGRNRVERAVSPGMAIIAQA